MLIRLRGCAGWSGERGGSVVECRTPEREVGGSKPTAAVLCPWARYFTPRKYWLITQEAVAPSRHDWKIVDWDVKPQHKQNSRLICTIVVRIWHKKFPHDVAHKSLLQTLWSHLIFQILIFVCPPPKERGIYCFWCGSCWCQHSCWRWHRHQRDNFLFAQYLMNQQVDFN